MQINGPLQCIVGDMTAFYVKGIYYELTLHMALWNNEILSHSLSSKRGDRMTYLGDWKILMNSRKNIRNTGWSCIQTKALHMRPRISMSCCRCMALRAPCPGPAHRQTTQRWRPSTVWSRQSCLWTCMLPARIQLRRRSMSTSLSSMNSALHAHWITLHRSSAAIPTLPLHQYNLSLLSFYFFSFPCPIFVD